MKGVISKPERIWKMHASENIKFMCREKKDILELDHPVKFIKCFRNLNGDADGIWHFHLKLMIQNLHNVSR